MKMSIRTWKTLLSDRFNSLKTSETKIVCYGTGELGDLTASFLSGFGVEVDYFVDTYKSGSEFRGHKTLPPAALTGLEREGPLCVLIASDAFGKEIYETVKSLGVRARLLKLPLFGRLPLTDEVERFRAEAGAIRGRFADRASRDVLDLLAEARLAMTPESYIQAFDASALASGGKQYLIEELRERLTASPASVADCGAYTGDTVKEMAEWGVTFAESWCFEPDAANFAKLKTQLARLGLENKVRAVNAGVHSKTETLRFNSKGTGISQITQDESSEIISVVSLDDYLEGRHVDFIKMDIEGWELEALKGAARTIERCRPVLAVCVYHLFYDLTRLPLYMMEHLERYKFMLRHHSGGPHETVLYCVPEG